MTIQTAIILEADNSGLVGKVRISRQELERLTDTVRKSGGESARSARDVDRLGDEIQRTGRKSERATGQIGKLRGILTTLGAALAAREIVSAGNAFIGYENALRSVTGTAEGAASGLAFVRGEADRLGLPIRQLTSGYTQLTAAAQGTVLQGEAVRDIFSAIAEQGRVLNLSAQDVDGALRAVVQIISKGKVQAEELRGQLGERLPTAVRALAAGLGVTTAELNKMLEQGEVLADEAIPALARELRKTSEAGVDLAANSPAAEFARMRNELTELANDVAQGGALSGLSFAAKGATAAISELRENLDVAGAVMAGIAGNVLFQLTRGLVGAATAATALRTALAFLGGPVGILVAVASGIAAFGLSSRTSRAEVKDLADEVDRLTGNLAGLQERKLLDARAVLSAELGGLAFASDFGRDTDPNLSNILDEQLADRASLLRQKIAQLDKALEDLKRAATPVSGDNLDADRLEKIADAMDRLDRVFVQATRDTDPLTSAAAEYGRQMRELEDLLRQFPELTDRVRIVQRALTGAYQETARAIGEANPELDEYAELLESLTSGTVDGVAEAMLRINIALEEMTASGRENTAVFQQLLELYERLGTVGGGEGGDPAVFATGSQFGDDLLGVTGELVTNLAQGQNGFAALGRAAQQAGAFIRAEFEETNETLADVGTAVQAIGIGLSAGQQGGSAGLNALSAGISTFAQTGNIYAAAAAAVIGAFTTPGSNRPGVTLRGGVNQTQYNTGSGGRGLDSLGVNTALGSLTLDRENDVGLTELAASITRFDAAVAQILGDDLANAATEALARVTSTFQGNDVNARQILEDRFATILSVVDAEIVAAVERFGGTLEDQIGTLGAALEIQDAVGRRADIFSGDLSTADALTVISELANAGETLGATYQRLEQSTTDYRFALELLGQRAGTAAADLVIAGDAVAEALGGAQRAGALFGQIFDSFFTDQDRLNAQLAIARERSGALLQAAGLGSNTTADEFVAAFNEAIASGASPEAVAALVEAGAALGVVIDLENDLAEARGEGAAAAQDAIDRQRDLTESLRGVASMLERRTLSQFQVETRNLAREFEQAVDAARAYGASQEQITAIQRAFALEFNALTSARRADAEGLVSALFGTDSEAASAAQQAELARIQRIDQASQQRYQAELRAIARVRSALDDLLLDESLTTLTPAQRLAEAQRQFDDLVGRARRGDVDAIAGLGQAGNSLLDQARGFYASSDPYNAIFGSVTGILSEFAGLNPNAPGQTPISTEVAALIAAQEQRNAERDQRDRQALAAELVTALADLAGATGESVFALATELGADLRDLTTALGVDLTDATAATTLELAAIAASLGVELTDLAEGVGFALGDLANSQSLLNDALELAIAELPPEFRDRLAPLLRDLENATTEAGQAEALAALESATSELPVELANALAPFLDGVDPIGDPALDALGALSETEEKALDQLRHIAAALGADVIDSPVPKPDPLGRGRKKPEGEETVTLPSLALSAQETVERLDRLIDQFKAREGGNVLQAIADNTRDTANAVGGGIKLPGRVL